MTSPQLPPKPGHSDDVVPSQLIRRYVAEWIVDAYHEEVTAQLKKDKEELRMAALDAYGLIVAWPHPNGEQHEAEVNAAKEKLRAVIEKHYVKPV